MDRKLGRDSRRDPFLEETDTNQVYEAETPNLDSAVKNDPNFGKLVTYFKQHPDEAEKVEDEVKKLEEVSVKKSSDGSLYIEDGVYNTYYNEKNGKYFKREDLEGGKQKTTEISKEEYKKVKKEYIKSKLISMGLSAAALGFVGALMAGPLGTYSPNEILSAVAVAAGIGAAGGAALGEGKEVEEGNLGHNEIYSIEPEGRFWIVTWSTMDGKKEKVFQSEDEAREFASTLEEGKEVEEPENY